jgi:glycosyltransferase involved in cell wall biosynthesis
VIVPSNVTIKAVSALEFRELIAGAYLVVFPLRMDGIRTAGQQSYLNAMALGKACVVTDTLDAPFYIEDGKTGLLTPSGDVLALKDAIKRLLAEPARVRAFGEAAQEVAAPLDQEYTWSRVLAVARETDRARRNGLLMSRTA